MSCADPSDGAEGQVRARCRRASRPWQAFRTLSSVQWDAVVRLGTLGLAAAVGLDFSVLAIFHFSGHLHGFYLLSRGATIVCPVTTSPAAASPSFCSPVASHPRSMTGPRPGPRPPPSAGASAGNQPVHAASAGLRRRRSAVLPRSPTGHRGPSFCRHAQINFFF